MLKAILLFPCRYRCGGAPHYWRSCWNCIFRYCNSVFHSWCPCWSSLVPLYQQALFPKLQVILPTTTASIIFQPTATNRSRVWGGDWTEWEHGLQTCKNWYWNEGKWSLPTLMCYSAQYQDLPLSFVVSLGNVCSYITFHLSYFVLSSIYSNYPKLHNTQYWWYMKLHTHTGHSMSNQHKKNPYSDWFERN